MFRFLPSSAVSVLGIFALVSSSYADVFVRVPFVRVYVGDGVHVRAPFVNIWVPSSRPAYYVPSSPAPVMPPAELAPPPRLLPGPNPAEPNAPPPVEQPKALTLSQFADSFEARAGHYEITLINPVTGTPNAVRFSLPEGSPRRVSVYRNEVEFTYGPRQFVRIQFDRDGAQVISR
jgi:hypothetical protein